VSGPGGNDDDLALTRPAGVPPPPPLPRVPGVTLQHEIARGGMGVVYRGRQDYIDRDVAVKLLSTELTDRAFVARFRREAKILAGIDHPNIVGCHFAGQTDDGQSYLVMEFVAGASLKRHIAEHGPMPVTTALRAMHALVLALDHAHQLGIIHRDVKPENILLAEVKGTPADASFPYVPKIVDLGLARANEGTSSFGLTSPGSVMGTPATMSPEQFDEPDAVDFRSDIYGLGCVLFEMLAGRPAFQAKKLTDLFALKRSPTPPDPCAVDAAIPAAVGALVQWMLATDRAARPGSYAELAERIQTLLADPLAGAAAARTGQGRTAAAAGGSSKRVALVGVAALALAGGAWALLGGDELPPPAPPQPAAVNPTAQAAAPAERKPAEAPKNVRVEGPESVALGEEFDLAVTADAAADAPLVYAWTVPAGLAAAIGPTDAPSLRLKLVDGLPGIEAAVAVTVRAGDGPPVAAEHVVRIADAPARQPLLGSKRLGSDWKFDRIDANWAEVPDAIAGLSCAAGGERRTVRFALGEDAYWEWSGTLESAEAEGTPFAVVAVRFCWPDGGVHVECRRQGAEGLSWTMAATAFAVADGAETRRALSPPLLIAYQQPSLMSDDAKADFEPRGWFAVRRLGGELQVQVGIDNKPPIGAVIAEGRSEWATLPAPPGPCRVELVVDKGIGRFFLNAR
jgi:tRNA A-37 threonylcarbamoyl transferase component Bud32